MTELCRAALRCRSIGWWSRDRADQRPSSSPTVTDLAAGAEWTALIDALRPRIFATYLPRNIAPAQMEFQVAMPTSVRRSPEGEAGAARRTPSASKRRGCP